MEYFNEVCILLAIYHLFTFSPLVPDAETRYSTGYSLIVVVVGHFVVSLSLMIIV